VTRASAWQRARPPREARAWVAEAFGSGSRVVGATMLRGGGWLANHAIDVVDGSGRHRRVVLRRWARPGWEEDGEMTAAREAAVLEQLARSAIPSPRVVAVDPDGARAGVPALVTTFLDGRPPTIAAVRKPSVLRELAEMLVAIQSLDGALRSIAAPYKPYHDLDRLGPPPNSSRPDLWRSAIDAVSGPPPPGLETFLHRDYHPWNTLWTTGRLTGVVDWTGASWGPPATDLAHLRSNLVTEHDADLADAARDAFFAAGGVAPDAAWWDLRTFLDRGPDLGEHGSVEGLARLEPYLERLLRRL
jgi:aminoglycoside phosphotransferase (APT) family kinase protein